MSRSKTLIVSALAAALFAQPCVAMTPAPPATARHAVTAPSTAAALDGLSYDIGYVIRVVGAEARGESDECQMAVAQCIAETALATGMTPEEVVKMPGQYASPVPDGVVLDGMEEVNENTLLVLECGERVTDEPIRYFYDTHGGFHSAWHEEKLTFVMQIGPMRFFKEK